MVIAFKNLHFIKKNTKGDKIMKTIIFDMGMVLVDFRWKALLSELGYSGAKADTIGKAMFESPLWQEFDRGVWEDEKILASMKEETPEAAEAIDKIWQPENFRNACAPFDYSEQLLKQLHEAGCKIYILSNYGKRLFSLDKEMFGFLQYTDGGVISAKVQQMKPDADIYQTLLQKYDIDPADAVFFDDRKENCEAARKQGIAAVEVDGLSTILKGIQEYTGIEITI